MKCNNPNAILPKKSSNLKIWNYIISPIKFKYKVNQKYEKKFNSSICSHVLGFGLNSDNNADYVINNAYDFNAQWKDVEHRYRKYIDILSLRLNMIHGTNYSMEFWSKAFSLGLLRLITTLHQSFITFERNFNSTNCVCKILSKNSFKTVNTFEEQRAFINASWHGQEQIFSLYINYFYPDLFEEFDYNKVNSKNEIDLAGKLIGLFKRILNANIFLSIFNKLLLSYNLVNRNSTVGLMGCYFSWRHIMSLLLGSLGKIASIQIPTLPFTTEFNEASRKVLTETDHGMDRFDRFFFYSLKYLMPKIFIESFANIKRDHIRLLHLNPKLKYIISEAWLGASSINLFRAFAYEIRGVKTLYNEHNCFFHPFVGDIVSLKADLVDLYLTLGWKTDDKRFLQSASLFEFKTKISTSKKYRILYVSYPICASYTYYSSFYSNWERGAMKHISFVKSFFNSISNDLKSEISYRGYPKDYNISLFRFDKESILKKHLEGVEHLESMKFKGDSCKQQMASAHLVVIDSPSTSYLESLIMNIPTIFFFDPDSKFLSDKHSDFFDDLIVAGIAHTTPHSAAEHLTAVYQDPQKWWSSDHTQALKDGWLKRNLGKPEVMINFLLDLAKGKNIV